MHLPYIYKMLERSGSKRGLGVKTPIVPIMVGNTDVKTEERFGEVFGRYLRDEGNVCDRPFLKEQWKWSSTSYTLGIWEFKAGKGVLFPKSPRKEYLLYLTTQRQTLVVRFC